MSVAGLIITKRIELFNIMKIAFLAVMVSSFYSLGKSHLKLETLLLRNDLSKM